MANLITGIISLTISAVVLASVFIYTIKNTSTCVGAYNGSQCFGTTWSTAEITMWGLLSLIAIVGMVYGVLNVFGIA